MVCFPYEQPANRGCETAAAPDLPDKLTGALIGLARATEGNEYLLTDSTAAVVVEGLCAALPSGNSGSDTLPALLARVEAEKRKLVPACFQCAASCGRTSDYDMNNLWNAEEDIRSLKSMILFGIRGIAAYASHAAGLGCRDEAIHSFLYKALLVIGMEDWGAEDLLPILQEMGDVNLKCMALLRRAYTGI